MTDPNRAERLKRFHEANGRAVLNEQEAAAEINQQADALRAATNQLRSFLYDTRLPSPVAVNLCRRARQLAEEAVDHLETAAMRLEHG